MNHANYWCAVADSREFRPPHKDDWLYAWIKAYLLAVSTGRSDEQARAMANGYVEMNQKWCGARPK